MLSDGEQGWRLTDVARVRFWGGTISGLSLLVALSLLRFSPVRKNQHWMRPTSLSHARNQESQGEKNHISLQLRNRSRFSLCEDRLFASHELQIRSYLEISGSIFEQTVSFTFLSNIHATCSLFHQFKGKVWVIFFHSRSLSLSPWRLKFNKLTSVFHASVLLLIMN